MKTAPLPAGRVLLFAALASVPGCQADQQEMFPVLTGEYLGQIPPDTTPALFAPGIVTTGMYTRDLAMTPDGREIYFGVMAGGFSVIMQTKLENGSWTKPEVAPFSRDPRYFNLEPAISPDGQLFLFLSTRLPADSQPADDDIRAWNNQDIWAMDRVGNGWGEPYNLGAPINSDEPEFFPSLTRDGTVYFTRGGRESYIYRSRLVDGEYSEPERLGSDVNSTQSQYNAFVAPDESYVIVCTAGREDTFGGTDYYVVFRNEDDTWSEPVNMGPTVNSPAGPQWSPYVSPDGRYLFFMSTRTQPDEEIPTEVTAAFLQRLHAGPEGGNPGIYWVDASFIGDLRP